MPQIDGAILRRFLDATPGLTDDERGALVGRDGNSVRRWRGDAKKGRPVKIGEDALRLMLELTDAAPPPDAVAYAQGVRSMARRARLALEEIERQLLQADGIGPERPKTLVPGEGYITPPRGKKRGARPA